MHLQISSCFLLNLFVEFLALGLKAPRLRIHRNTRYKSSDIATKLVLNTFADVSFGQCIKECGARQTCISIEYRHLGKYCSLRSAIPAADKSPGFITVSGFGDETILCGDNNCTSREVCKATSNTCSVKECGYHFIRRNIKGNRFEVGSKLIYEGLQELVPITCTESGDWLSQYTDRLTCLDIRLRSANVRTGVYTNQLNMTIHCDFDNDGGDWLVFQRRRDGSVDFYRNWTEYKTGFGDVDGEFWFGLENLHAILKDSPLQFEMRVDLEDWEGNTAYAVYSLFDLGGESDGYRLNCSGYSGIAGDSLSYHNGQRFTTRDRDNDLYLYNCGVRFHGAWWYAACFYSNLNGRYFHLQS